jgi:hypothetical protein
MTEESHALPTEAKDEKETVSGEENTECQPVNMENTLPLEARAVPVDVESENEGPEAAVAESADKTGDEKEETPAEVKLCKGTKKNGGPCTVKASADGYCFAHSPALAEKRKEAREKGGFNSSKAARLEKLSSRFSPVSALLENVLKELSEKKIDPRTAQAIASVSKALVSVMNAGELEERLRLLEMGSEENPDVFAQQD